MTDPRTRNEFVYLHREELQRICIEKETPDNILIAEIILKARKDLNYSRGYPDKSILETLLNNYRTLRTDFTTMQQTIQIEKIVKKTSPVLILEEAEGQSIELASVLHRLRTPEKKAEALLRLHSVIADTQLAMMQLKALIGNDQINDIIEGKLKKLQS